MCKYQIVIFLFLVAFPSTLCAQCIDNKTLGDKLALLDRSITKKNEQLQDLLRYDSLADHCPYRIDSTRISLLERISKLFVDNAEYQKAAHYTLKAINIVSKNIQSAGINPLCQIKNFYTLASIYGLLNKNSEKIGAYDSCIAIAQRTHTTNAFFLYSLLEKVKYQNNIGDYDLCITQASLGEEYCRQNKLPGNLNALPNISVYQMAFVKEKANALLTLELADDAEMLLLNSVTACNTKITRSFLGVFNEDLAIAKMQQQKYNEALAYFNKALISYKEQNDAFSYKCITHNIGYLYDSFKKNDEEAMVYYKRASAIRVTDPRYIDLDAISSLNIYSNIGNLFARRLQFDSAQHYFQMAFNLIKKGTNESEVLTSSLDEFIRNQKVEYLTGLFVNKGNAFYKQYLVSKNPVFVNEAIRMYTKTDRLLERIRTHQLEIQSKLFWRKITHPFYEQAIEACIKAGRPEDAFYFFERSRAILLYDEMKEQRGFSKDDILQQQRIINDLATFQQQLTKLTIGSDEYDKVQRAISSLKDRKNNLLKQIRLKNPLYFSNFLDSNSISLKDMRRTILYDHALVEIFTGDSCVYSMIVTLDNIYFNRINKTDYERTMYSCLAYMSDYRLVNKQAPFRTFLNNSRHLYNLVFQGKILPDLPLIFSEDGQHFPFETLVINKNDEEPVYLVQKHAVSYTYSARFLMNQFSKDQSITPGDFLGIAPVKFPSTYHLAALHSSDIAIINVAPLFRNSDKLLGPEATKNNFLNKFGKFQIIQLFTHSSDTSDRKEPVLYFADTTLYLSELSSIKSSSTRLLILSACETGTGKLYQGEGVFSFNRGFAALGVPSCINNLWSVDNESTYKLCSLLYKNISQGLAIDKALQAAKLEYLETSGKRKQSPYFWAATILAGKTEAIQVGRAMPSPGINMMAALIMVAILLLIISLGLIFREG